MIFAPIVGRKRRKNVEQENPEPADARARPQAGKTEPELFGFRPVYVWDVSQTEGEEPPKLDEATGDPEERLPWLIEFVESQAIKFEYSEKIAPARGMSYGGKIQLLPAMTPAETFSTLVHETAHELIHKAERRTLITKTVKETEAEAVAFVVLNAIGLETTVASASYIQLYHGNAALLQESLGVVQRTAAIILGAIAPPPKAEQERSGENKSEATEAVE